MQYPNTSENSLLQYKFKRSISTNVLAFAYVLDGLDLRHSNVKIDLFSSKCVICMVVSKMP